MGSAEPAPLVSVLMPVRDGGRFLAPALDSILGQTGVRFEVLVVDDGSRDGSSAVLAEYAARHPQLRIIPGEGRGISRALNLGLDQAQGPLVARMDADDLALPGRLAAQVRYLERYPEVGALGTQARGIDGQGRPLRPVRVPVGRERVRAALEVSCALIHPTVMLRRDLVRRLGGYRSLFDAAEDYDLWLRLVERTQLDNLPDCLLLYRRHPVQQTRRRAFRQARRSALALFAHQQRRAGRPDPCADWPDLPGWRAALVRLDPNAVTRVRQLTAASLVDNGGTLSPAGGHYLRLACRLPAPREVRRRLALACVRHQLQLLRAGRWPEAALSLMTDLVYWRASLLLAFLQHGRAIRG